MASMADQPVNIGPYEISREIGRGGMGVVYLARDTKLDRDVAIKALPPELAEDADRLARFAREAKTLAQLNHTNIAGIHGIEEQDGQKYLILEYVKGETLAERLDRGALPVDDAIEIAIEIAAGVEAAHEAGIIHRDLKPDNIKIAPDGKVKVLDFGLARTDDGVSGSSVSDAATVTSPTPRSPTEPGAILGTAPYMSPEQARGRRVDKRTDIWSFGVILYELLTGISPFVGETVSDSIGAILHKDIDLERLPPGTPLRVRRVIERCLQRDRQRRLRDIGDARLELQVVPAADEVLPSMGGWRRSALLLSAVVITALAALAIGYSTGHRTGSTTVSDDDASKSPPVPLHFDFPIGALTDEGSPSQVRISPADRMIVAWTGRTIDDPDDAPVAICVHDLRTGVTRRLDGTELARMIAFSPDGSQIAFHWDDPDSPQFEYRRVSVDGGPVVRILAYTDNEGYADEFFVWMSANEMLLATGGPLSLHAVSVNTGVRRTLGEVSGMDNVFVLGSPCLGPEDTVFLVGIGPGGASTFAIDLETLEATRVLDGGGAMFPIAPDRVAFAQENTLFVAPFDAATKSIRGSVRPVLDGLSSGVSFTVSKDGDLLAVQGERMRDRKRLIYAMDRQGQGEALGPAGGEFTANIVVSPDGSTIATNVFQTRGDVEMGGRIIDRATGAIRPVRTEDGMVVIVESYAPDGRLAVVRLRNINHYELMLIDPEGDRESITLLPESDQRGGQRGFAMTPDHRYVLFEYLPLDDVREDGIYMVDLSLPEAEREAIPVVATAAGESAAAIAPQGDWIAYTTNASGRAEVVARAFDPERPQARVRAMRVSANGGERPIWSRDGSELFYLTLDGDLMSAAVTRADGEIAFAEPEVVLTIEQTRLHRVFGYYVMTELPDEDRFLFIREPEAASFNSRYKYIMNWTSTLEPAISPEVGGRVDP